MPTVKDFWLELRGMARQMAPRFGFDLRRSSVELRGLAALTAAEFAVLLKLFVDKGIVTEAEVQAAFLDARDNNAWDVEPITPVVPSDPPPPDT